MRTKIFLLLAFPVLFFACNKNNEDTCSYTPTTAVAPANEIEFLKTTLDNNSITYSTHPSGIFYQVGSQGAGTVPNVCSDVTVKYSGRLINSTTPFDESTTGVSFTLGQLITGWQIGIPLIQKGGSITLYIPPSLGYGAAGAGANIPPNSYLVFTIELMEVQ